MATISLGMIVKNEAKTLKACLDSVVPFVSQVVIGLGGESTDETEQILRDYEEEGRRNNEPVNYTIFQIEWTDDFSAARQQVLEKCTGEYFLWLDGDDVLVGGDKLQKYIQINPNVDAFYMGYDYARDEDGINNCYLIRERLIMRHPELPVDWKWLGKVHEVLVPTFEQMTMKVDDIVVVHHKPPFKHESDRNLKILYEALREGEPNPDPRLLVYLGNENLGRGEIREGILHLQRFVKLSGWNEEKYQAQVRISNAWRMLGDLDKALKAGQDAIAILPEWPDAYYSIAKTYQSSPWENWRASLEYLKIGTQKPKPQTMLIINPLEYTYEPAMLIAIAYTRMGDWDVALQNYQQAYAVKQDPLVLQNMQMITEQLEMTRVQQSFLHLREFLGRHDEWLKVRRLFDVVPKSIEQSSMIREVWERTMDQTAHIDDPKIMVDFYNDNPHWQPMDEKMILDPSWLAYPRMRFALEVARRVNAKQIVDWGCSDGFISLPLAKELNAHVTGFDIDPRCTELATIRGEKWGVDSRFEVGNIDEMGGWGSEKADLAIFFEVLEHVVDPAATLSRLEMSANHIAITTPYLAWEAGNLPAWDKVEPKGHLRIFDQFDIERLLTGRGQIMNIYREPWGPTGWLFADYAPGIQLRDTTIIIGAPLGMETWGPRKLSQGGLGGSETAVIKLAESIAKERIRPIVYNPIDEPGYYNGVCYRPVEHFRPEIRSDLFIAWRWPEAADKGISARHLSLWLHDTDAGDRLTRERASRFDSFVVLSRWHREHLLKTYPFIDAEKVYVIGNGVDATRFSEPVARNLKKVVYTSSPDRGLDVVLEHIWPKVVEQVPDAELHIYYGWQNVDVAIQMPGMEHLANFKHHVNELFLNSKNVVQHGRIPQDRLARELQEASIWLYPTYFSETYCISAVEAQLAGAIPVTNKLAALGETVKSGIIIDGDVHDPSVQEAYVKAVVQILQQPDDPELRERIKSSAPVQTWDQVASQWLNLTPEGEAKWRTFSTMLEGMLSSEGQSTGSLQPSEPS